MIISRTPVRMSFVGGGSDMRAYYAHADGAVLSVTLDQYVYVTVNRKFDDAIRVAYSQTETVESADAVAHPLVREALKLTGVTRGVEITTVADIPAHGTGLGSSSAFTVGLVNALDAYCGRHASRERLAQAACEIEIERCGEPIGKQDQYASAYGGLNLISFHGDERVSVSPLLLDAERLRRLQSHVLVLWTGRTRPAASVLADQQQRVRNEGAKRALLARMTALAYDLRVSLERGDIDALGQALDENWRLKRQLTDGVSSPEIDGWYDRGLRAGATGGKLLGAGGGGFLMFYAPPERHAAIIAALPDLQPRPMGFDPSGSRIIYFEPPRERRT